jgi:segregation and condensation protein B
MSLKAQLEAVIYAADEPVTLAQLAILFADEALAWKAEQEAAKAEAQREDENAEKAIAEAPLLEGAEMQAASAETSEEEGSTEAQPPEQETAEEGKAQESTPDPAEVAAADTAAEEAPEGEAATEPAAEESSPEEPAGDSPDPAEAVEAEPVEPEETEEARVKRLARQRDREVKAILRQQLDELVADYATDARGVEIREIAGGYRMATKPECHDAVRGFVKSLKPALKLSLPALETLAVIAYKQPVTAPEVNEIRGVDSSGVFGSLLARKLIATAGRKQVIGRPILYKTTKEFLLRFGLKDVNELPSMEEFEKMAASELDDSEEVAATEAAVAPGEPELDENLSEGPEADEPEESESAQLAEDSEPTQPEAPIVESPVAD